MLNIINRSARYIIFDCLEELTKELDIGFSLSGDTDSHIVINLLNVGLA